MVSSPQLSPAPLLGSSTPNLWDAANHNRHLPSAARFGRRMRSREHERKPAGSDVYLQSAHLGLRNCRIRHHKSVWFRHFRTNDPGRRRSGEHPGRWNAPQHPVSHARSRAIFRWNDRNRPRPDVPVGELRSAQYGERSSNCDDYVSRPDPAGRP